MNYYAEKRRMQEWAEIQISSVFNLKGEADLEFLAYKGSKLFLVGEKTIKKRLEQIVKLDYPERLAIHNGVVKYVQ